MPGPGQRQKAPRGMWRWKQALKNKGKNKGKKRDVSPPQDTGPSGGEGHSGYQGPIPPWGANDGGPVETEDQRSKRMEKEDANVRGYVHGGKVKGYGGGGKVKKK